MTENTSGTGVPPSAPHEPPPQAHTATQTAPPPPYEGGPRVSSEEMRDLSRLRRSSTDKKVAGVAGGIGRHLDIDPVILRVAFVVFTFFGGAGLLVYGAGWLLLPRDDEDKATLDLDPRSRNVALIAVGALAVLATVGDVFGGGDFWLPFPLLIVGAITWWLLSRRDRKREKYVAAYGQQTYGQQAGWVGAAPDTASGPAAPPGTPGTTYGPPLPPFTPPVPAYTPPPKPRDPRKRGPLLFWITVPLIPFALGLLGVADLTGADVADSAYPALALGIIAGMLVLGAFWGRAGGLIVLGLLATLVTAGVTASEHWDGQERRVTPLTAAEVESSYDLDGPGEMVLDLTEIADLRGLDGRTIELDAGVGRIEVIVPNGINVTVDAEVGGPGDTSIFGDHEGGIHVEADGVQIAGPKAPQLHIDAFIGVGEIEVKAR
jgi:phage shock protein PspC (stress-responsive transcriptional regulator)